MGSNPLPLRDIHLPQAIGWWPPAPGWWLAAALLIFMIAFGYWLYKRLTKKTAIKAAKKLLLQIKRGNTGNSQKIKDISALIRRVAISTRAREECAGLTGKEWLEYLNRSVKSNAFTNGAGRLLTDAPYQNNAPTAQDIAQLIALCEDWLKAQTQANL